MNSTDFNKIAGAGLGALLIFLLLNFFSGQIYGTGEFDEGEEQVLAYALPVEEAGGDEAAEEPQVDFVALVAAADPAAGESEFRACTACHAVEDGVNKVGPHLYDVVGRDIAAVEGFNYSDALVAAEGAWTFEHLSGFLENPKAWAPGTKMAYAGIDDPQELVNVIAYLNEVGGTPVDLAEGLEPLAEAAPIGEAGTAIPDPSLSPGVGPGPGVNPPGEAMEGAPAPAESAGVESMSEAAEIEEPAQAALPDGPTPAEPVENAEPSPQAGAVVTGVTTVRPGEEDVEVEGTTPLDLDQEAPGLATGQALPETLEPGETRAAPRAEPLLEPQPLPTPPGQTPASGPGGPGGVLPEGAAPPEAYAEEEQEVSAAPVEPAPAASAPAEPAAPAEDAAAASGGLDFASADVAAGEQLFRRCSACHKVEEGRNGIGPSLWNVVGRPVAAVDGFNYSDAMVAYGGDWTPAKLFAYLENPKAEVPGTKMAFAGLKNPQDRIDVIAYLNEHGDSPQALQQ